MPIYQTSPYFFNVAIIPRTLIHMNMCNWYIVPRPSNYRLALKDFSRSKCNGIPFHIFFTISMFFYDGFKIKREITLIKCLALLRRPSVVCLELSAPTGTKSFRFSKQLRKCARRFFSSSLCVDLKIKVFFRLYQHFL